MLLKRPTARQEFNNSLETARRAVRDVVYDESLRRIVVMTHDGLMSNLRDNPLYAALDEFRKAGWKTAAYDMPGGALGPLGSRDGRYTELWGSGYGSTIDKCASKDVRRAVVLPDFDLALTQLPGSSFAVDITTILESKNVDAVVAIHTGFDVIPSFDYNLFDTVVLSSEDQGRWVRKFAPSFDCGITGKARCTSLFHRNGHRLVVVSR